MSKIIFNKTYTSEEMCDVERDISEALDSVFNPLIADIQTDGLGFHKGEFEITITYKEEN